MHTKFQTSELSDSEEQDIFNIFYAFLRFKPKNHWSRAILDPGSYI